MWNFLFLLLLVPESLLASTERRELRLRVPSNHKEVPSEGVRRGPRRTPMKFGLNRGPITFGINEYENQQIVKPYELVDKSVAPIRYSDNYIPARYPSDEKVHPHQQYAVPDTAQNNYPRERPKTGGLQASANQASSGSFYPAREPAPIIQVLEGDGSGLGANGVGLGLNVKSKQVLRINGGAIRNREPAFKPSPYYGEGGVKNVRYVSNQALIPNVPKQIRIGSPINAEVGNGRPRIDLFTAVSSSGSGKNRKDSVASPGQLAIAAAVQSQGQQTASSSQYQYETTEEAADSGSQQEEGYGQEGYGGQQEDLSNQGGHSLGLGHVDPAQSGIGSPNEVGSFGQSSLGQLGIGNSGISGVHGAGYEDFLKKYGSSGVLDSLGIGHRTNPLFAALLLNNIIISNQKGKPPNALNYGEANQHYLGMMLKQYGKYLPYGLGSYGLYGYSASNNLHNSKAFGQYKHEHAA